MVVVRNRPKIRRYEMALTPQLYHEIKQILEAIGPETGRMTGSSSAFVQDQQKRFDEYGSRMFLSDKQVKWLRDLYEEFGPGVPITPYDDNARQDTLGDDEED